MLFIKHEQIIEPSPDCSLATSSLTACVGTGVGGVNYKTGTIKGDVVDGFGGLMPTLTFVFGEGIKAFFGWDDAVVYLWE